MRLACVAGSNAARIVNEPRYPEFVDMADLHLAELRTHVTRITAHVSTDAIQKCLAIESRMSYVLVRLRRGPKLDRSWLEFSELLANLAAQVLGLIELLYPRRYTKKIEEVASIVGPAIGGATAIPALQAPDEFVRSRFMAQSMVLRQIKASGGPPISTIRDDIDKRLAVPYFAIDTALLRATVPESPLCIGR
jgi:hypothetical protein